MDEFYKKNIFLNEKRVEALGTHRDLEILSPG